MKYKIIIKRGETIYFASLYKRYLLLFWKKIASNTSHLPYSVKVDEWVKQYHIDDRSVEMYM